MKIKARYSKYDFRGNKCLITDGRIWEEDFKFITENDLTVMGIRHNDEDDRIACSIEKRVIVNRYGYLIVKTPLSEDEYFLTDDESHEINHVICEHSEDLSEELISELT